MSEKITVLSYAIAISEKELKKSIDNIYKNDENYQEEKGEDWFEYFEDFFEEEIDLDFEYVDMPSDNDNNFYIGITHEIKVGKNYSLDNTNDLISLYDKIFTKEKLIKLFPMIGDKKPEFLIRVSWR
jgi:hypothetical protein